MRIKAAFQKIKCVYPHIKTKKDIVTYKVDDLLIHPNVKEILGQTNYFSCGALEEFAGLIKPFIDSSNSKEGNGKSFAQWPLVKVVRLDVKSRILEDGVCLVDLPGSHDTNAARGAIAENYQKNLSVSCIVAPTTRAASDKPAQDLLGSIRQRTLQLDNRFSSDQLCFIVSKCDTSLKMDRYIKTHPNVETELELECEKEQKLEDLLRQRNLDYQEKLENTAKNKETLAEHVSEMKKLNIALRKMTDCTKSATQKRKRSEEENGDDEPQTASEEFKATKKKLQETQKEAKALKSQIDNEGSGLYRIQEKIKQVKAALLGCESKKTWVCIKNRNEVSANGIRKDYDAAAKFVGKKNTSRPLQVFCVSSLAFTDMSNKKTPPLGFLKLQDTGIPGLQNWLIESTLQTRKQNADALLETIVSFQVSIAPWIADTSVEFKMPESQRRIMEDLFDKNLEVLVKQLTATNSETVRNCEKVVESGVFSKMPKAETAAVGDAERIVKKWAQKPIAWGTHRAVNKGQGTWTTYKGVEHKWNDELAGGYLDPLLIQWTRVIHNCLPSMRGTYDDDTKRHIETFVKKIVDSATETCPDMTESLNNWKESTLRTLLPLQKNSLSVFDTTMQEGAREAHRMVTPKVLEAWKPVYTACGAQFGNGHFKRNKVAHIEHVNTVARGMYKKGSAAIRAAFRKLWDVLPEEFNKGTQAAVAQIGDEFEIMLNNHTLHGDREVSDRNESAAKVKLQQEALAAFETLKTVWAGTVEITEIVDDEEVEDQHITLDLFNPDADDDMDFGEFDSD